MDYNIQQQGFLCLCEGPVSYGFLCLIALDRVYHYSGILEK